MKPTLPTPNCTTENDFLWFQIVCLLEKLDLAGHGDINSVFKWIIGEE